jgi:hypothetical protein
MVSVVVVPELPRPAQPPPPITPAIIHPPVVLPSTIYVPPRDSTFAIPVKDSLPLRMRKIRRNKDEKVKARKDSSGSDTTSAVTDKADKVGLIILELELVE